MILKSGQSIYLPNPTREGIGMKKHKHKEIQYFTTYYKDRSAKVTNAECVECGVKFPDIVKLFQDREDQIFQAYGNKPPIVWDSPEQSKLCWTRRPLEEINLLTPKKPTPVEEGK